MQQELITKYREKIEKEKEELMVELKAHSSVHSMEDEQGAAVDPEVQSDEAEEYVNDLAIADALRNRINEIDRALNNMHTGTYGTCTICGKTISEKALDVAPTREHCTECQRAENA